MEPSNATLGTVGAGAMVTLGADQVGTVRAGVDGMDTNGLGPGVDPIQLFTAELGDETMATPGAEIVPDGQLCTDGVLVDVMTTPAAVNGTDPES